MTSRDKNLDGDNSSLGLVSKILEFQRANNDEPVAGKDFSDRKYLCLFFALALKTLKNISQEKDSS